MSNQKSKNINHASLSEHVRNKSMWLGASKPISIKMHIIDKEFKISFKSVLITPSLLKLLDEILVNSMDHYWEMSLEREAKKVRNIKVNFRKELGSIEIFNDGDGISLIVDKCGKTKAELVLTEERTGSNLKNNEDKVVGGTNGLGMKLISCLTDKFYMETADHYQKKKMILFLEHYAEKIHPPRFFEFADYPFTLIKFLPSYDILGYKNRTAEDIALFDLVFKSRVYFASVYLSIIHAKEKCAVFYNDLKYLMN